MDHQQEPTPGLSGQGVRASLDSPTLELGPWETILFVCAIMGSNLCQPFTKKKKNEKNLELPSVEELFSLGFMLRGRNRSCTRYVCMYVCMNVCMNV